MAAVTVEHVVMIWRNAAIWWVTIVLWNAHQNHETLNKTLLIKHGG